MAAHDVAFSRPEVNEEVWAAASRAMSSTSFGEHERMLSTPRERTAQTSGDHHVVGFHRKRDDAVAVKACPRGLLLDHPRLIHPIPVQVAAPYADGY